MRDVSRGEDGIDRHPAGHTYSYDLWLVKHDIYPLRSRCSDRLLAKTTRYWKSDGYV